jgi:hypothetical protein
VTASFEENVQIWWLVVEKAKQGVAPTATAMAKYLAERTANDTLQRTSHPAGMWYRQRPGEPPAMASGKLAESMFYTPAHRGGLKATAYVGNSAEYSRILEYGCVIQPSSKEFSHWVDTGGSWYHKLLISPPHPYLQPTVEEAMDDGGLRQAAIDAFTPYDP